MAGLRGGGGGGGGLEAVAVARRQVSRQAGQAC